MYAGFRIGTFSILAIAAITPEIMVEGCPKPPSPAAEYSMIITSDPQYPWYERRDSTGKRLCDGGAADPQVCRSKDGESSKDCVLRCGAETIDNQISSIKVAKNLTWPATVAVRPNKTVAAPVGIIVNGDLTEYWHAWQREWIRKKQDALPQDMALLPGFGNHDYANNLCDCHDWIFWDGNSCARNAVITARELYRSYGWLSFDNCSMAYSYDIKNFHFVQLQISPSFEVNTANPIPGKCPPVLESNCDFNVHSSLNWLENDLKRADDAGKISVINMHAAKDPKYWTHDDVTRFKRILSEHHVGAVFAGHIHDTYGYLGDYCLSMLPDPCSPPFKNSKGKPIPFFQSGAAEYYTYLLAEFGEDKDGPYINVGTVSALGGDAKFLDKNAQGNDIKPTTFRP